MRSFKLCVMITSTAVLFHTVFGNLGFQSHRFVRRAKLLPSRLILNEIQIFSGG